MHHARPAVASRPSRSLTRHPLCTVSIKALGEDDPLHAKPAVEPPITRENVVGRFLLAPPWLWPGVSAGGWCVKVTKSTIKPDITAVKFNESTVDFSFAEVAAWKPVS